MTKQVPIFCYGTLRTGLGNYSWALNGKTTSEETATLNGAVMYNNNGGFPFVTMTDADPIDAVIGDLMYVQPHLYNDVIGSLDGLEGYYGPGQPGNMYERTLVTVVTEDGHSIEAYTYLVSEGLYQRRVRNLPVVVSGNWLTRDRERARVALAADGR